MTNSPPPNQPPPGYLKLHLQGNAMLALVTPSVQIDGHPAPTKYGENVFPVYPGAHTVSAHGQWLWKYGQAAHPFQVGPGETAELWYAAPVITFIKGAMGTTKQKIPGLLGLVLALVALPVVVVLAVVLAG